MKYHVKFAVKYHDLICSSIVVGNYQSFGATRRFVVSRPRKRRDTNAFRMMIAIAMYYGFQTP